MMWSAPFSEAQDTTNGLVGYYPFNGNASDESGNGYNAKIVGTNYAYGPGRFDQQQSLFLNTNYNIGTGASGSFVVATNAIEFNANFTLSVWVNIPDGLGEYQVHSLISDGTDQTSANFRLISNVDSESDSNGEDYLQFVGDLANDPTGDGANVHAYLPQIRNTWWQAVVVRSGASMSLFQNGVLITNGSWTATVQNNQSNWFGAMNYNSTDFEYWLVGGIADVQLYSNAFSPSEVQQLYVNESGATLTAIADPMEGGTVIGGGLFAIGTQAQLLATPNPGWSFTEWNDGVTNNPRLITVPPGGASYAANFQEPATITVLANPIDGGTVAGGGIYDVGSQVEISAIPDNGWTFIGWNDGITNNPRLITVPEGGATYAANFQQPAIIEVLANPINGGTVAGGGTYDVGSQVEISAIPNNGWTFTGWNDGITNNPRLITAPPGGALYEAIFQQQSTVVVLADPFNGGTVAGAGNYEVGSEIEISATAGNGWMFTGWNDGSTQNPRTVLVPLSGAAYAAGFTFNGLNARYAGLFYDTNNGVAPQSSGSLNATLTANRNFSATLLLAGKPHPFSGKFSTTGTTSNSIARTGQSPLSVQLSLTSPLSDVLSGTVTDGTWTAEVVAELANYSTTNHAQIAGKYTMGIPGVTNPAVAPGGFGYGAVTVSSLGSIMVNGKFGDGTAFSQTATLSAQGHWPFYVSIYSGSGEIFGWLDFSSGSTNDISGLLSWIKPAQATSKLYPSGFTNQTQVIGSGFVVTNGHPVLNYTNGNVLLSGGNLAEGITNAATVAVNGKTTGTNHLNLTVSTISGLFTGSVINPETKKTITLSGAVLEKQNIALGFFLGTNQSGNVLLESTP